MSERSDSPATTPATQTREPGAPFPAGAIDPELVNLRRHGASIGPALAASVVVFCAYAGSTQWADFRFSRGSERPTEVEDLSAVLAGTYDNQLIALRAIPDRSFAAQVTLGESGTGGQRVAPVLGTSDRLWLAVEAGPWSAEPAYSERYIGRVRPLDDVALAEPLAGWVAAHAAEPRYVTAAAVRAALTAGASALAHPAGGVLATAPDTEVSIVRRVPARAQVRAWVTEERADAPAWALALRGAGLPPAGERAFRGTERAFWFEVAAPSGLDAVRAQLASAHLYAADVSAYTEDVPSHWGELAVTPSGLAAGERVIPWDEVSQVAVASPHRVPADARIVLTGERPASYWFLLPLYLGLGALLALFGWALLRSLRAAAAARAQ
jgi:hypothetical protein